MARVDDTLARQNRLGFDRQPEVPPDRTLCEKLIREHARLHPGLDCLQSFGWHMCGWRRGSCEEYNETDYDLLSLTNRKFLELFTAGYKGYVACRCLPPAGNGAKSFSDPVVFEVTSGRFRPPEVSGCVEAFIGSGMVLVDTFFQSKLTLKDWEKTVGTREKESYRRM